jgi:hypothetical protein
VRLSLFDDDDIAGSISEESSPCPDAGVVVFALVEEPFPPPDSSSSVSSGIASDESVISMNGGARDEKGVFDTEDGEE